MADFLQLPQSRLWRLVSSPGSPKKQRRRGGSAPPCRNLAWGARFHLCGTGTELSKGNEEELRNWVFVMTGETYPQLLAKLPRLLPASDRICRPSLALSRAGGNLLGRTLGNPTGCLTTVACKHTRIVLADLPAS